MEAFLRLRVFLSVLMAAAVFGEAFADDARGSVRDDDGVLNMINVVVVNAADSSYVANAVTDAEGRFAISGLDGIEGKLLYVSAVGYETSITPLQAENEVKLTPSAGLLGEVVVTSRPITHTASGYVATLDQSRVNGRSLSQVMSLMPFVKVDEGSLSVLSRKVSAFYIDGMKTDNYEEIKMLPSEAIKSVKVEYSAGAGEAGSAGPVVRITLRQPIERGYYGQVWATGRTLPAYGYTGETAGGYFTTQQGPLRITAMAQYDHRKMIGRTENAYSFLSGREFTTKDRYDGWQTMPYGNLVLWWKINERNTLGASLTAYRTGTDDRTISENTDNRGNDVLRSDNNKHQYSAILSWDSRLRDNLTLKTTAHYISRSVRAEDTYLQQGPEASTAEGFSRSRTNLFKWQGAMTLKAGKSTWMWGVDLQYTGVRDRDTRTFYGEVPDLKMTGWRPAEYVSYSFEAERLSLSAGLRLESSWMSVKQSGESHSKLKTKTALCPDLSLTYLIEPEKGTLFNIEYRRSMEEMPYSVLSTYPVFLSPQSYSIGNPRISTPTSDLGVATFSYMGLVSVYTLYHRTAHPIYYATSEAPDGSGMMQSMAKNGKYEWVSSTGIELNLPLGDKVAAKLTAAYKMMRSKNVDYITPKKGSWDFDLEAQFNFTRDFGGNVSAHYETASRVYDMRWSPVWHTKVSLFKFLFNRKLRLNLDCTPYRKGRRTVIYGTDVEQVTKDVTKSTGITLSARIYFGSYNKIKGKDKVQPAQEYHEYTNPKAQR